MSKVTLVALKNMEDMNDIKLPSVAPS